MRQEFLTYMRSKMSDSDLLESMVAALSNDKTVEILDYIAQCHEIPQPTGETLNAQWLQWHREHGIKSEIYLQPDYTGAMETSRKFNRLQDLK